jgi:outer membrane protein X
MMRKLCCIFFVTFSVLAGYAQKEHLSVGVSQGIAADYGTLTFGVDLRYNLFSDVRMAPSITRMIRHQNQSAWYLDLDGHYMIDLARNFSFYPIGGIGLSIWETHSKLHDKVTHTRLGFNVGLGGEVRICYELSVGLDMKYNVVRDYHQALAAVRVAYHF